MPNNTVVVTLLSLVAIAGEGCASAQRPPSPPQLTSAAYATSYRDSEAAAQAITTGAYPRALALADQALASSPDNPWAYYDRAVALHHLGQVDDSVRAYGDAERRFAATKDAAGQGISVYGRAHTLAGAGRCGDANSAYNEYAALVRKTDPKGADMALEYARECKAGEPAIGDPVMTKVGTAILARDYPRALELTSQAGDAAKKSGWVDYNRAIALDGLERTDDAVGAFHAAETRFAETNDRHGREVAIYGRARALDRAKRCAEARQAYEEYSALVRSEEPRAAEVAMDIQRACVVR
jgi:tetratricopeptide (TPR) repeat protein